MNSRWLILVSGGALVAVACSFLGNQPADQQKLSGSASKIAASTVNHNPDPDTNPNPDLPRVDPTAPVHADPQDQPPLETHYDTKALDDAVRAEALRLNVDPKTHRMLIRTDDDGTKIYRVLGMHIIAHKNGEKYYLPDEI